MATATGSSGTSGGHAGISGHGNGGNGNFNGNGYYGNGYNFQQTCPGIQRNQATIDTLNASIAQCNNSGTCPPATLADYQTKLNATMEATASVFNQCQAPSNLIPYNLFY